MEAPAPLEQPQAEPGQGYAHAPAQDSPGRDLHMVTASAAPGAAQLLPRHAPPTCMQRTHSEGGSLC